jgi:hypothetical protein
LEVPTPLTGPSADRPRDPQLDSTHGPEKTPPGAKRRIQAELRFLGYEVAALTVAKYMRRASRHPSPPWRAFLAAHRHDIAAIDFFVVPTLTFRLFFGCVILRHHRRELLHIGVTDQPTGGEDRPSFEGRYYRFHKVGFSAKPMQRPRIPIWVGGEGSRAQRRAARYGDAWFPYFVRIAPRELAARFDNVRRWAREAGRDPEPIRLACCLPIELTPVPVPQEEDHLRGSPEQLAVALRAYGKIGVEHIALQFMVPRWPERREQIERFAQEVMPGFSTR